MPNWCSNAIEITGPKDKIKALWEAAQKDEKDGGGLLQALHPMPQELIDTEGLGDGDNWYSWRVTNWQTKWEISTEGLGYDEDGDSATVSGWFDSAWSPPIGAAEHYATDNPDVKITLDYYEPGMCFVGRYTIEEGVGEDVYFEYGSETSETVRDLIGEDMDDMWNISEQMAEYESEIDDDE